MSEHDFLPIPQAYDFEIAFRLMDDVMSAEGGAPVVASGEATFSVVDQEAMAQDMQLAQYSTLLIPYEADSNDPDSYAPAHAFSRGFMMTTPVNDIIYNGRYVFRDYFSSLDGSMNAQGVERLTDPRQRFEAGSLLVRRYGEYGLYAAGMASEKIMRKWADSLFSDPALVNVCLLGCGAVLASGIIHQRTVNEQVMQSQGFQMSLDNESALLREDN